MLVLLLVGLDKCLGKWDGSSISFLKLSLLPMRNSGTKHNWITHYLLSLQILPDCPQNQGDSDSKRTSYYYYCSIIITTGWAWFQHPVAVPSDLPHRGWMDLALGLYCLLLREEEISPCPHPTPTKPWSLWPRMDFFQARKEGIIHPGSKPGDGVTRPRRVTHTLESPTSTYLFIHPWGSL